MRLKIIRLIQIYNATQSEAFMAGAEPETDVYTALHIITNHTRCCWAYECTDQSETFRWVIAVFFTRLQQTEYLLLVNSLVITQCRCVYESVRYSFLSVNSFVILMGVFESAWTRLSLIMSMFFALYVYNESIMISSLTDNVFIHINFQC